MTRAALSLRRVTPLRLALHLAVWAPFAGGVVEAERLRWRAVADNAAIALRSWDQLTAHGPLVGQLTFLAHGVYDPGPLQYWLQAIPVHLDPRYGVLWGAALWCMVAASVAIEAAWSVLGGLGGVLAAAVILGTLLWQPDIALAPCWNPWFGAMFFLAAIAAAWAVLAGHRRWWAAAVVTGSVASQAHLMFALACAAVVLLALAAGLADGLHAPSAHRWVRAGLLAGAACWIAPVIQQLTSRPGNLTSLLHGQGTGRLTGIGFGLKTLAAATQPPPLWWTSSDALAVQHVARLIADRSAWFGGVALVLTAAVLVAAARPLRSRPLAALAAVSLAVSAATLVAYSSLPATIMSLTTLVYVDIVILPVGVLTWLAVGSAAVLAGRQVISRPRPRPAADHGSGPGPRTGNAVAAALVTLLAALVLAEQLSSQVIAQQQPATNAQLESLTSLASRQVERALPSQPIALCIMDGQVSARAPLMTGIAWELRASGYRPEVVSNNHSALELGRPYTFGGQQIPLVTVHVRGSNVSVSARGSQCG